MPIPNIDREVLNRGSDLVSSSINAVHPDDSFITRLGRGFGNKFPDSFLTKPFKWYTSSVFDNPLSGGVAGAIGAGTLGAGFGLLKRFRDKHKYGENYVNPTQSYLKKYGLISAILGGLGSAGFSYLHNKKASFLGGNYDNDEIIAKIHLDPSLNWGQKSLLTNMVKSLSPSESSNLKQLLSSAFGASVGLIISRYLLKLGIGGQAVATIAGGVIGNRFAQSDETDRFGNKILRTTDVFGRPR